MSQIDFSKKPEGATHFGADGNYSDALVWYRDIADSQYQFRYPGDVEWTTGYGPTCHKAIPCPDAEPVIDWSKGPADATHWGPATVTECWPALGWVEAFYKLNQDGSALGAIEIYDWSWHLCGPLPEQRIAMLIERPAPEATCAPVAPQWDGEGLPPVGVVCERSFSHSAWKRTTICGHSSEGAYAAFYDGDGLMGWSNDCKFRPIRTPEQIAADERDKAINEMGAIFDQAAIKGYFERDDKAGMAALYDAGCRKAPGYDELLEMAQWFLDNPSRVIDAQVKATYALRIARGVK